MNTTISKPSPRRADFNLLEPGIGLETGFFWFNENTNVNPKTGKPCVDPKKLKWFRNVKFRQACSYAIDRDSHHQIRLFRPRDSELRLCDARQ